MDWNDVRYFLALARTGSVRGAGACLKVSHSTVARRVEALEERLSARLFDRSREGFALTAAGRQMLATAERVEREMAAIERGLAGRDERLAGPVRITCCDEYVAALLVQGLAPFCADYPEIELGIITDMRPFDLSKREADIAVRILSVEQQPPQHYVGRKVVPLMIASYVAIEHEARLDPELPGTSPRWIAFDDTKTMEVLISGSSYPQLPAWGYMASISAMVESACAGLGLTMLPTYVGDQEPRLRRLAQSDLRHMADIWLLTHPDLRDNARLLATREHVFSVLKAKDALFSGAVD